MIHPLIRRFISAALRPLCLAAAVAGGSASAFALVSIAASGPTTADTYSLSGGAYVQTFDTLPVSGTFIWTNDSTLTGWSVVNAAGTFNATGVVSDGSSNLADLVLASVGTTGNSDRALAFHTRLNTAPTYIGLGFINHSGRALDSFTLSYTAEQWRENTNARNMTFTVQYRVGATVDDLGATTGWTTISGLDFTSLNGSAPSATTLTATAVAVSVPDGTTLWFRWITANSATTSTTSNDTIAIDQVTVSVSSAVTDAGPPVILTSPDSQTVALGAPATFSVTAAGAAVLTYQWRKDGVDLPGATAPTFTISTTQAGDAGVYTVVVANGEGSATSEPATLAFLPLETMPVIVTPPSSQSADEGAAVNFAVEATGGALTYQWRKDGSDLSDATAATLTIVSAQVADAGDYTVVVTNSTGAVTSVPATLTVRAVAPEITSPPTAQSATFGGDASFSVVATGTAPLAYQWSKDGTAIPGAVNATLTLTNVQASNAGTYTVTVTNDAGSTTSSAALLTVSSALPVSAYNLTGFATLGSGTTGGGVISESDPAYRHCATPLEFVQAILDANKTAGKVKVIEIMNDLNLGWNEVGSAVQALASNPLRSHAAPKLHPDLIVSGVSLLDIKAKSPLTIFSANGATIKHCNFNVKGTSNLIIRNLKFDEMWEWDEASKGNYDSNDWDFITLSNGGDATNIWIDHCTFTKAYDGVVDLKAGTQYVTLSWCRYIGDDGATNLTSSVRRQLAALEATRASRPFYNFLRTNGYGIDDIATIIQGHDKGHLMGSNSLKAENNTLSATFHHLWFQNVWDRAVPRLRGGNAHDYNIYVDDTGVLAARRLRDARAAELSSALRNTLNNTYSFNPPINGAISTEGGAVLVEKSIYADCLWPLRNNQTDPSNPIYTGKIKALDTIYSFLNADNTTTVVRGNSTDPGNPLGPFQATVVPFSWNLPDNKLPYAYTMDDPAALPGILAVGAGAGALTWSKDNWLKTVYETDDTAVPAILAQPVSQSIATGADATFTVQATGSGTLAYQWKKDGAALIDGGRISGATTSVLTIADGDLADAGSIVVVVTNAHGSIESQPATLTVTVATSPVITTPPQSQTAAVGEDVFFTVAATGSAPFSYQWKRDGNDLIGATDSTLTLSAVQPADSGAYTVVVSNPAGTVTSAAGTLTVQTPTSTDIRISSPSDLTWYKSRTVDTVTPGSGSVAFVEGGISGSTFLANFSDITLAPGDVLTAAVNFTTGATVNAATSNSFRWGLFNSAATQVSADFNSNSPANTAFQDDNGYFLDYNFDGSSSLALRARTKNTGNTLLSSTGDFPSLNATPSGTAGALAANTAYVLALILEKTANGYVFTARLNGGGVANYALTQTDTTSLSAALTTFNEFAFYINGGTGATSGLVMTGLNISVQSAFTDSIPVITTPPSSQTVTAGQNATLGVTAGGTAPLTYQWKKDGGALSDGGTLSGATTATLTLTGAQLADAGSYTVAVMNSAGTVESAAAVLTVTPASYAGTYFGTFGSGGSWALYVRADQTGVFIVNLPSGDTLVQPVTIASDGSFTVTGDAPIKPANRIQARSPVRGRDTGSSTFTGQITGSSVTGQWVEGPDSFSGTADVAGGAAAGYYSASALGTSAGTAWMIVGPSGQTVIVLSTSAGVTGGAGTIDANGQLSVTTTDGAQITASIDPSTQQFSARVLPSGATTPVTFAGLPDTVTATHRLVNLSARGDAGAGDQTLIVGFVIAGSGSQDVLVRGVGPGLVPQGITVEQALTDPQLQLFDHADGAAFAQNDTWGGTESLRTTFSRLGAFALADDSLDAAIQTSLVPGRYTAHVTSSTTGGIALAEIYDGTLSGPTQLTNVSVRGETKPGADVLIGGFVVEGNAPMRLLIRGVGPSLVKEGVGADTVLVDPQLTLYRGETVIETNDNWGGTTAMKAAFQTVGAFSLDADASLDAALLVTLEPGSYTVHLLGMGNTSGVALLEIYAITE